MKTLILFVGWCILFVLCWPVALLALILFPVVWLLSLPLRLIDITLDAIFALVRALLFLPAACSGGGVVRGMSHESGNSLAVSPSSLRHGVTCWMVWGVHAQSLQPARLPDDGR